MVELFNEWDLLYGEDFVLNNNITIHQPTIKEIKNFGEEEYYNIISIFTSTPSDYKVQLFDAGIDYNTVDEFELFCDLRFCLRDEDIGFLFKTTQPFNLSKFQCIKNKDDKLVLWSEDSDIIVDKMVYIMISSYLKKINCIQKDNAKAGNEASKSYFIERDRRRQMRRKNKPFKSQFLPLISTMANMSPKYDYYSLLNLPIYMFYDSLREILRLKNIDHIMNGIYAGTVDSKKLNPSQTSFVKTE